MNVRIALAGIWLPGAVKKRKLLDLVRAAAEAFPAEMPDLEGKTFAGILDRFVDLAQDWSRTAANDGRTDEVAARLFLNARHLGKEARAAFRPKNMPEVMAAARILYAAIGIDFRGDEHGRIKITRCRFSRRFTPGTCRLMSAMDAGILAGLAGSGNLAFFARLTEGAEACLARFSVKEDCG